jgi:hypothetical protein
MDGAGEKGGEEQVEARQGAAGRDASSTDTTYRRRGNALTSQGPSIRRGPGWMAGLRLGAFGKYLDRPGELSSKRALAFRCSRSRF